MAGSPAYERDNLINTSEQSGLEPGLNSKHKPEPGIFAWAENNLWLPLKNSAILEPYNAIGNILPLPKVKLEHTQTNDLTDSVAQTVAKAIGSIVPYLISAKLTNLTLKPVSANLANLANESSGLRKARLEFSSNVIGSSHTSMIIGGVAYGALRDPEENESRIGNALGNLLGFSIFELGAYGGQGLKIGSQLALRAASGFAGGAGQFALARKISQGDPGSINEIALAGLGGTVFNTVPTGIHSLWQLRSSKATKISSDIGKDDSSIKTAAESPPSIALDKLASKSVLAPELAPRIGTLEPSYFNHTKSNLSDYTRQRIDSLVEFGEFKHLPIKQLAMSGFKLPSNMVRTAFEKDQLTQSAESMDYFVTSLRRELGGQYQVRLLAEPKALKTSAREPSTKIDLFKDAQIEIRPRLNQIEEHTTMQLSELLKSYRMLGNGKSWLPGKTQQLMHEKDSLRQSVSKEFSDIISNVDWYQADANTIAQQLNTKLNKQGFVVSLLSTDNSPTHHFKLETVVQDANAVSRLLKERNKPELIAEVSVPKDPIIGKILSGENGQYRVDSRFGNWSSFGRLYNVVDTATGKPLLAKIMVDKAESVGRKSEATDALDHRRFEFEQRINSILAEQEHSHPNLFNSRDSAISELGGPRLIIMDIASGGDAKSLSGKPELAAKAIIQTLSGLERIHDLGIVHLDVKPNNIFLGADSTSSGWARLADFGSALTYGDYKIAPGLFAEGTHPRFRDLHWSPKLWNNMTRTEGYSALEIYRENRVGPFTDIYSTGATLFRLLTDKQPASSSRIESRAELAKQIDELASDSLLKPFYPIVKKAMESDRSLRYQSASEMRQELERALLEFNRIRMN